MMAVAALAALELDWLAVHAGLPAPDVKHVAALWFHVE